jgi:hypothetical protein
MTDQELVQAGYTPSGAKRYRETMEAYAKTLHEKSLAFGEASRASDASIEVTHDHVRSAAHSISSTFGREQPSPYSVPIQVGEYFFTALAGIGGGSLKESWGVPLFVVSVALAVILFVVRNTALRRSA